VGQTILEGLSATILPVHATFLAAMSKFIGALMLSAAACTAAASTVAAGIFAASTFL
jgi:hypothetical protein